MIVRVSLSALRQTTFRECLFRFIAGGIVTVATGLVVRAWGPVVGGLFLAFPAIFPATATLLEKHERRKKESRGQPGTRRGRAAVAIDASGPSLGAAALLGFGAVVAALGPHHAPALVLAAATALWLAVASVLWVLSKRVRF